MSDDDLNIAFAFGMLFLYNKYLSSKQQSFAIADVDLHIQYIHARFGRQLRINRIYVHCLLDIFEHLQIAITNIADCE